MSTKLETETGAYKTIEAYRKAASEAGLVLRAPQDTTDSGDYPRHAYIGLRYIRRVNAVGKECRKIIRNISRALVTVRDEKGKPIRKEVLWYSGDFRAANHRGIEYGASFEIGKYQKPKIVPNVNLSFNPKTGEPQGPEKILSGVENVFEIDVPKTKELRKKLIDSILGDENHPDNVLYYVRHLDSNNYEHSRDASFTYEEFCNLSIEELLDTSQRGAGGKSSQYYTDKEGKLRFKRNDALVSSASNKPVYQ